MRRADLVLLISIPAVLSMLFFGIVYSDSKLYISLTRYFLGIASKPPAGWLSSRPLIPLLASPLSSILYIPTAYGVLNTLFWIGSALLFYLTWPYRDFAYNRL